MEEGSTTEARRGPGTPGPDAEDLQAVAETLRGNTEAFRIIVDHHNARIYRLANSYLGNREDAEEASQEIFFKAFRSLRSFRLEKPFLPWLYAVAMNHLRTRYARIRRVEERIVRNGGEVPTAAAEDSPAAVVESTEAREEIRRAIAFLPAGIREAVSLYYLEALSVSEVSVVLGIGVENVKSRLFRGRKMLKEILGPGATGEPSAR
jgi:RNA polymerase sigma-70 factor (ECF subfamily)